VLHVRSLVRQLVRQLQPIASPGHRLPGVAQPQMAILLPDDGPPASGARPAADVSDWGGRVAGLDTETRVLRRYFFQDATASVARGGVRPGSLHFDVLIDAADKIDASTDHLRYRYVDFLTTPGASSVIDVEACAVDIQELEQWLQTVRARTRLDGYPLFRCAKEVLE
jgi:hypothetical protein